MNAELHGQIRHLLTAIGGAAVTNGWVSDSTWQLVSGILVFVIGAVWSFIDKKKAK